MPQAFHIFVGMGVGLVIRVLFATDLHIRGNSPVHRTDDYRTTVMQKVKEVGEIARREAVDVILIGGDWFDRPDTSHGVVSEAIRIFREYPVTPVGVLGNHDIFGQNPETQDHTVLGVMFHAGIVDLLNRGDVRYIEKDGLVLQLTGSPFHYDVDRRNPKEDYYVKKQNADVAIHIVHAMLVDQPYFFGPFTLIYDVKTEADIVLSGHYHPGFHKVHYVNGTYFANPGSLTRSKCTRESLTRMPKVLLIDIHAKDEIAFREVYLESARPGEEVFDLDAIERAEERRQFVENWDRQLELMTQDYKSIDPMSIIDRISQEESIDPEVIRRAKKRLSSSLEAFSFAEGQMI